MEETITLALRAVRHPQTGLAAVLASVNGSMHGRLSAIYLMQPGSNEAELIAVGGPDASSLGGPARVAGPDAEMVRRLGVDLTPRCEPPSGDEPAPWDAYPCLARLATALPSGAVCVLLVAADACDPDLLRRASAPVALLATALVSAREIEALRREAHRARQDRTLLAAGLQHDLRAPLTAIVGSARTLRERSAHLSQEERNELLDIVGGQAERLSSMMSEALEKGEEGPDAPVRLREVEITEIARRSAGAARVGRGGEILIEVPGARLVTDSGRVERALLNLLDNALKYSPPDQAVHLLGEQSSDGFTLTVADAGPGVSPAVVPTLFSAYATDPNRSGGTGLGLHSVARLARDLGGRIAYSRKEGWTRFSLTLPAPDRRRDPELSSRRGWA